MTKTEATISAIVLSFAAGILAWSYTADYRSAQSVAALDSLREQCKGVPGWANARVLLDSVTAQPYCLRSMDGTRNVHLVRPMNTGVM
jgi:hypothetical protein